MKIKKIEVVGVSKTFNLIESSRMFLHFLVHSFKPPVKKIEVLKKINFDIYDNEIVGIIGRNGSGKSTLLKIIAELYSKDSGIIKVNGKSLYINGFSQATNPELTVKENIFLNATIFGLTDKQIKSRLQEIIDFSGLKDFLEVKVQKLSSGMIARLNFSIAFHCIKHRKPEILLLDEVFSSGGDLEFQKKSIEKMEELIKEGATVLLVSHSEELIKKYCKRVIWLEKGKIKMDSNPQKVFPEYKKCIFNKKKL